MQKKLDLTIWACVEYSIVGINIYPCLQALGQGGQGQGVEDCQPGGVEEEQEGGEGEQHGEAVEVQAVQDQGGGVGPGRQAE